MVKETTMYTTAKKVDVLQAIKKCTKKYEKALTNLAKQYMILLEKEHIYMIHNTAIENFGGENGIFNNTDDKIESILSQQYGYFEYDKYPTIFDKCAMLSYFFVKDYCFRDGNKRVSAYMIQVFLDLNGYELTMTNEELQNFVLDMASSYPSNIDDYIFSLATTIEMNSKFS